MVIQFKELILTTLMVILMVVLFPYLRPYMNAIMLRIWALYQNARNETMKAMSEARCNPFKEFSDLRTRIETI